MNYAGFGTRLVAFLIDGLIVNVLLTVVIGSILALALNVNKDNSMSGLGYGINLLLVLAYWIVYQSKTGQTIGKKIMKIKVVDAQGKTPTMMTFFLREIIGKFVSAIILGIGYLMVLWDPQKQALHDKIASTYVVKV